MSILDACKYKNVFSFCPCFTTSRILLILWTTRVWKNISEFGSPSNRLKIRKNFTLDRVFWTHILYPLNRRHNCWENIIIIEMSVCFRFLDKGTVDTANLLTLSTFALRLEKYNNYTIAALNTLRWKQMSSYWSVHTRSIVVDFLRRSFAYQS